MSWFSSLKSEKQRSYSSRTTIICRKKSAIKSYALLYKKSKIKCRKPIWNFIWHLKMLCVKMELLWIWKKFFWCILYLKQYIRSTSNWTPKETEKKSLFSLKTKKKNFVGTEISVWKVVNILVDFKIWQKKSKGESLCIYETCQSMLPLFTRCVKTEKLVAALATEFSFRWADLAI